MQIQSYSELNKTGFYKIIKKYDKTFHENKLDEWLLLLDKQSFVVACPGDISNLTDIVTSLVSRNKLMEWEVFAKDLHLRLQDDQIFPSVKVFGLIISLSLFLVSLFSHTPSFYINDPASGIYIHYLLRVVFTSLYQGYDEKIFKHRDVCPLSYSWYLYGSPRFALPLPTNQHHPYSSVRRPYLISQLPYLFPY